MNISSSYNNTYANAYTPTAGFRRAQSEAPTFAETLDKVSISREALAKTAGLDAGGPPEKVTAGEVISITQVFLNSVYGDPEELEKQTEEWKKEQMMSQSRADEAGQASGGGQAKEDYAKFMDKLLGRGGISGAKSPEERIKELTGEIKALQAKLSEVASNQDLPESVKASQASALNAKINGLHAQIAELAKSLAEESVSS